MIDELEARFMQTTLLPLPTGPMWGRYLVQLQSPGAQTVHARLIDTLGFRLTPFGVDFTSSRWFFFHQALQMGHFTATPGPSRWRDTQVYRLDYGISRLPVRGVLYDEVKPMPDGTVLGMGGLNGPRGQGEHFFFELRN